MLKISNHRPRRVAAFGVLVFALPWLSASLPVGAQDDPNHARGFKADQRFQLDVDSVYSLLRLLGWSVGRRKVAQGV